MIHRLGTLLTVAVAALVLAGSALAFDCIRVSSSFQGLKQSTNGGHWLLFDMTDVQVVQSDLSLFTDTPLTLAQAMCVSRAYLQSGQPVYFAFGFGVAGGFTNGSGVLAGNNPNDGVLGNLKGIDHLDDSPIGAALFGSAAGCGVAFSD